MILKKLSVLIPCYNEEATIVEILSRVVAAMEKLSFDCEILISDDGSTDNTALLIQQFIEKHADLEIKYIPQQKNAGKGAAVSKAIPYISGDFVIIQDADLEYDPMDYGDLIVPIIKGNADVVYGSRFSNMKPHRVLLFWHYVGNKFLTFFSNLMTNLNLSDMEVGLKVFRVSCLKQIDIKERGFGFEPEVTAKISRLPNIRFFEVGISYYGRTYAEGKKITWRDGVRAIYCILKYNLFSRS